MDARSAGTALSDSSIGCESGSAPRALYTPSVGVMLRIIFWTRELAGRED